MDTDFQLIRKMKQGNEAAFEVFVKKYYSEIFQYCKFRCFDREYAQDLTQETFVHFFTRLTEYQYLGKTKNYLYTIARNLCKDYYKKKFEVPIEEIPESEDNQCEAVQNKLLVEWALNNLPDELREVIILYYFQDLKLREIAGVLKIGLPLVKYRMRRAKELLKDMFGEEDIYEFRKKIQDV